MRTRTKEQREAMEDGLEIQANLAYDIASRSPWMKELLKSYPRRFFDLNADNDAYYAQFDKQFARIYGEVFPTFISPTLILEKLKKRPSELFLRIDLNYTEDEIMHRLGGIVHWAVKTYQGNRKYTSKRKHPRLWRDYLEIWDLKAGYEPWLRDSRGMPFAPTQQKGKKHPWTYEQIAKFKYPSAQEPQDLKKAISKVKKQYRAACRLIYGKKFESQKSDKLTEGIAAKSKGLVSCDLCPDKPHCKTYCPQMMEELARIEVRQRHYISPKADALDLVRGSEKLSKNRYATADRQFAKMK